MGRIATQTSQGAYLIGPEQLATIPKEQARTLRWIFLGFGYVSAAAYGAESAVSREMASSKLPLALAMAVGFASACICDARVRSTPFTHAAQWISVFAWPIATPVYLLWSRKWRGLFWLIVHSLLFVTAMLVGGIAAWALTHFANLTSAG